MGLPPNGEVSWRARNILKLGLTMNEAAGTAATADENL